MQTPMARSRLTFRNGTCGVLSALQIVDGFLKSHAIDCALIVASDADPGRGMSEHFPFSAAGAALLCDWTDDDCGVERICWTNAPDEGESFNATVGLVDGHNVLRFAVSDTIDERFAAAAIQAVDECLRESSLRLDDIDVIVAAPARPRYRTDLAARLGVPEEQIIVAEDESVHTASVAAAFDRAASRIRPEDASSSSPRAPESLPGLRCTACHTERRSPQLRGITIRLDTSPASHQRPTDWSPRAAPALGSCRCE